MDRQTRAPARRAEVLATAAEQFRTKGYAATSVQDIADSLGMLKGSLYHYIESKEDLLYEVIRSVHEDYVDEFAASRAVEGTPLERIHAFVRRQVLYNAEKIDVAAVFTQELSHLEEGRRKEIQRFRAEVRDYLIELITAGQADGEVADHLDPSLAAMAIFGMMNWLYQWYRSDGPRSPDDVASQFAEMAVRSLR